MTTIQQAIKNRCDLINELLIEDAWCDWWDNEDKLSVLNQVLEILGQQMGDEYDENVECCGKHCDKNRGLKYGMGWNRYYTKVEDMITKQLFCEDCLPHYVNEKCKGCCETYPYTEMEYKNGGGYGVATNNSKSFYCKSCVEELENDDPMIYGIICKNCNVELPPMRMSEHLDINSPKNKCDC